MKSPVFLILILLFGLFPERKSQVFIGEVFAAPGPDVRAGSLLLTTDWIELCNSGNRQINLDDYCLSDKESHPFQYRIGKGISLGPGECVLFLSERDAGAEGLPFRLNRDGEKVILYTHEGKEMDRLEFPVQYGGISYGRLEGGVGYLEKPSPGEMNQGPVLRGRCRLPDLTLQPGIYYPGEKRIVSFEMTDSMEVFYTLDGRDPDRTGIRYSDPIVLDSTLIIKYRAFAPGRLPSETGVAGYIVAERDFLLPVVSLVSDPEGIFSDSLGIYVRGKNGVTGYCNSLVKRNYCRDWERRVYWELFSDRKRVFSSPGGIKIHGNCSRNFPQRSLALFARRLYGEGEFRHFFFQERAYSHYEAIVLRNSGNDFGRSMLRDGLMARIAKGVLDVDYSEYQPVVVFLNGEYWGLYNMREKVNEHHPAALHGIDPEGVNLFENKGQLLHGSGEILDDFMEMLKDRLTAPEEKYARLTPFLDVNSFIDYMIAQIYCANTDWPVKNIKFWNSDECGKGMRWILFDTDLGFGLSTGNYDTDMFRHLQDHASRGERTDVTSLLFAELSRSRDFRLKFSERFRDLLKNGLDPDRVVNLISETSAMIEHEMGFQQERWMLPEELWKSEIEKMIRFAGERPAYLQGQLEKYLKGTYLE